MTKPIVVRSTENAPGVLQTDKNPAVHGAVGPRNDQALPDHPDVHLEINPEILEHEKSASKRKAAPETQQLEDSASNANDGCVPSRSPDDESRS